MDKSFNIERFERQLDKQNISPRMKELKLVDKLVALGLPVRSDNSGVPTKYRHDHGLKQKEKNKSISKYCYLVHTDGGCHNNRQYKGIGGWAFHIQKFIVHRLDSEWQQTANSAKTNSGGLVDSTNNRAELLAVINALKEVKSLSHYTQRRTVRVVSDSQYVIKGITAWISGWQAKNFEGVKNADLWQELLAIDLKMNTEWCWVKGHASNPTNNLVDNMCSAEIAKIIKSKSS